MNVIIHNPKSKKNDESISFPSLQCWNPLTKMITIAAQVSGKRVSCRVSVKDLRTKFHVFKGDPMEIVSDRRKEIENAARELIEDNSFEHDGSIMIRYEDL